MYLYLQRVCQMHAKCFIVVLPIVTTFMYASGVIARIFFFSHMLIITLATCLCPAKFFVP